MQSECLQGIIGTTGIKTAARRRQRRKCLLIDLDQQDQDSGCEAAFFSGKGLRSTPAAASICSNSLITSGCAASLIRRRGMSTMRHGRIRLPSRRKLSHIIRRARFRSTASRLNFLLHITPHLANFPSPGATETAISEPARRKGALLRRSNSDLRCSLELLRRCKRWSAKIRSLKLIWNCSGGQSLPTLLTAAFDDQTSGMGSHTGKETDPAFTAPIGGLKSSFHLRFFLIFLLIIWCSACFLLTAECVL